MSKLWIIFTLLSICEVSSTIYNHTGSYNCSIDVSLDAVLGFPNILPATNIEESIASLKDREYRILSYFAQIPLPLNSSLDDNFGDKSPFPTNPFFNSRNDTYILCSRWISRILLGCYNNSDIEKIFLKESTRPFALPGFSALSGPCTRDGDYDFVTINLVQLLYIAKENSGSMSAEIFALIRDKLLTIFGRTIGTTIRTYCHFLRNITVVLDVEDTENHVLQVEISRYLTNQLLLEIYPNASEFNNTLNGNKDWMLKHLATFLRTYFIEYNSRPYQLFTVKALSILHSYANEKEIVQVAEMILNVIGVYSSLQTNHLRRFVPFMRQTPYINKTESWQGDSEFYRLAILVGNYATLDGPNYTLPGGGREDLRQSYLLVNTVANKYRLSDDILRNFFRQEGEVEYFIGNHDAMEIYYSTPRVLISGGGHAVLGYPPNITFPSGILPPESLLRAILESIYTNLRILDQGQTRSTTIIPSVKRSMDIRDMMRFEGSKDFEKAAQGRNLCVAPGFACGMQFQYGRIIDPIKDQCSMVVGDWRFFDLSDNNALHSECPKYGFYMAVYERQCNKCSLKADTYGLVEIVELVDTLSFESFQQMVIANNPQAFTSHAVHKYKTIDRTEIEFQIDPGDDAQSQLLRITSVDNEDDFEFNRNYRKWPMLRTSSGLLNSASAIGRWTFDAAETGTRTIYDVGNPLQPVYQAFARPNLVKYFHGPQQSPVQGSYFDDSSSVIDGDGIASVTFHYDFFGLRGFQMQWRGTGLQSTHGSMNTTFWSRRLEYTLALGEYIVEVGIGTSQPFWWGKRRVNRVRLVTNQNRVLSAGFGMFEQAVYNTDSLNVIAFFGQADDKEKTIYKLGVVAIA
jgi:hypothetical protein